MTGRIVVVGLGPAGPDLVTAGTLAAIERIPHRYLRTARHPAAPVLAGAASFDDVYERSSSLEQVYAGIVDELAAAAADHGEILYAVPGSPVVAERTVELLMLAGDLDVEVLPALSFLDLAWARLAVDPVAVGARIVDGHRFAVEAAGERGPLLVAQCDRASVLSDVKLAVDVPPELPVTVLQRLGLPDEVRLDVAWADLDRSFTPDHLTSLWIPELGAPVAGEVQRFVELVATLRERCPWDAEQTHASLAAHLLEEAYETLDALDALPAGAEGTDPAYGHLEEELGDLLFQICFHAQLATESGAFTLADVTRRIHDKLVGRHPHVFGEIEVAGSDEVVANWERIKQAEKGRVSVFDGIPRALPALAYAHKVLSRAHRVGIDQPMVPPDGLDLPPRLDDAVLGRVLMAVVAAARAAGIDAEDSLRRAATARLEQLRRAEPDLTG